MPRAARWVVVAPLAAALAVLVVVAHGKAQASLALNSAAKEMIAWSASGTQPGSETWGWVHDALAQVAAQDPANATAHELLGAMAAVRADTGEGSQEALRELRAALERRPVSPYTWASYAEALYRSGDTGRAFEASLERAVDLGTAEPGVQRTVALYGLAVYDEINAGTRRAVDRAVSAGLRRDPAEMMTISQRRGRLDVACRLIAGGAVRPRQDRTQYCKERQAPP